MLYFKTKRGRLFIQVEFSKDEYVYILVPAYKKDRLPAARIRYGISERVWEYFKKITDPQVLNENEEDLRNYEETESLEDEFWQQMADEDWMFAKACEFYGTNKKL